MSLERTPEAQRAHDAALAAQNVTQTDDVAVQLAALYLNPAMLPVHADPFTDDEPLTCGVENPETCESCQ